MKTLLPLLAAGAALLLPVSGAEIKVFAAASLTDALKPIAGQFESAHPGDKVLFNFAGSNVLAIQIEHGAPADLFFSADEAQMDAVAKAGLIDPATRRTLLDNQLVVVIPADSKLQVTGLADLAAPSIHRLALADPRSVPAGVYAKAYFTKAGVWDKVAPQVIPAENVRAALAAVASGNVDAGVVYRTDALSSKRVRIAFTVPLDPAIPITYPAAIIHASPQAAEAKLFLDYLASAPAAAIFSRYGFVPRSMADGR
jgi:molybdate transport system substrate-binding protein